MRDYKFSSTYSCSYAEIGTAVTVTGDFNYFKAVANFIKLFLA
jgi:hypothetical protein